MSKAQVLAETAAPGKRGGRLPATVDPAPFNRSSAIHRAVQQAIVEQRLLPGTKLTEDQLGGIFGVSRTLVRAALQSLARDGMVVLARNKGAFVASPSVTEARELFDARRVVEAETVARAALAATPADCKTLDHLMEDGRRALDENDRGRAIRLSGDFHLRIAAIARQGVLQEILTELVARSSLVIALYGHSGRSDCGDAEHGALLGALRRHDGALATRLMTEHLRHVEADLDLTRHARATTSLADVLTPPEEPARQA